MTFSNPASNAPAAAQAYVRALLDLLGTRDPLEVNVQQQTLRTGDCYLLCCDGLTDEVPPEQIQSLMGSGQDLEGSCRALVEAANDAGGEDNITVVLVRVGE